MEDIIRELAHGGPMFDGGSPQSRAEIASEWADHDFGGDDVSAWVAAGCWDPASAAELRDAGFRPGTDTLSYRAGHQRDDMDAMYALCNGDRTLARLTW